MSIVDTLKFITSHPLTRDKKIAALARFVKWQLSSRLFHKNGVEVEFATAAKLFVKPGMTGATGNIYVGLHEFEDMAFMLHYLRPSDLFIDVGANIGSYTVLASKICGAKSMAIEPIPSTFSVLSKNIQINEIEKLVIAKIIGIGRTRAELLFTADMDTTNHILLEGAKSTGSCITIPVWSLDELLQDCDPTVFKIDVEGYEPEVIQGAKKLLARRDLNVVLVETNGSGSRYGFDDDNLHDSIMSLGFKPCRYEPMARRLTERKGGINKVGNTLYIRDADSARKRIEDAELISIYGDTF